MYCLRSRLSVMSLTRAPLTCASATLSIKTLRASAGTFKFIATCVIRDLERPWPVLLRQAVLLRTNTLLGTSNLQPVLFRTNNLPRRPESMALLLCWTGPIKSVKSQPCRQTSQAIVTTLLTPTFEVRGNPVQADNTPYSLFTKEQGIV